MGSRGLCPLALAWAVRIRSRFSDHAIRHERIALALDIETRHRSVPRHELHVTERPKLLCNRVDQVGMVAAWKIRPADRSLEQDITYLRES